MQLPEIIRPDGPKRQPVTQLHEYERAPIGLGMLFDQSPFEITDEDIDEASNVTALGIREDPEWRGILDEVMRSSCAFFAQEMLTGPPESPYNGKFLISEHHEEWDELIANEDRVCVLAPRDHSKTFFFDFAYPIWKLYYNPRVKGFIFSATANQAQRILGDIKEELESNPKLQWLVPERKEIWSNSQIKLTNGAILYARGFGTRVRGAHPNFIICDDSMGDETAYSETVRSKQVDYFYTAITNMIVPSGQIVVVGTPFHEADLYADLEKNAEYAFRRYQAWDEESDAALWPDRYDLERLMQRQREIGTIRFQREFQCVPIADEMSLFPSYLFKGEGVELFNVTLGLPLRWWEEAGIVGTFMGVDIAMSAQTGGDYFVSYCLGLDKHGNRYLLDIDRHKGLAFQAQLSHINAMARKYRVGLVYIEANQMQRVWGDELIRLTDLPIKKFVTSSEKHALDKGIPSLRILLENGKFRIPRGDTRSIELTDEWIKEMRAFTFHDGKVESVGSHDDIAMACWICDQACRLGAFSFTFGDEDDMEATQAEIDHDLGIDGIIGAGEDGPSSGNGSAGDLIGDDSDSTLLIPDPFSY